MKVTIITVCFNAADGLHKTLKSIVTQTYKEIEWIIVDGNSQDNTKDIIEKNYASLLNSNISINFKSEKDNGIYDAMNKGIYRATGEWCIFMNAGDTFYSKDSLEKLVISNINEFDIVYGDVIHVYKDKFKLYSASSEEKLKFIEGMEFCHQSTLIKKKVLEYLKYDTGYRIAGDFDFFVRAFRKGFKFKYVNSIISQFEMDGISSTNAAIVNIENNEVKFRNGLISQENYKKNMYRLKINLWIRNLIPKKVIVKRHEMIMKKATMNWNDIKDEENISKINKYI